MMRWDAVFSCLVSRWLMTARDSLGLILTGLCDWLNGSENGGHTKLACFHHTRAFYFVHKIKVFLEKYRRYLEISEDTLLDAYVKLLVVFRSWGRHEILETVLCIWEAVWQVQQQTSPRHPRGFVYFPVNCISNSPRSKIGCMIP